MFRCFILHTVAMAATISAVKSPVPEGWRVYHDLIMPLCVREARDTREPLMNERDGWREEFSSDSSCKNRRRSGTTPRFFAGRRWRKFSRRALRAFIGGSLAMVALFHFKILYGKPWIDFCQRREILDGIGGKHQLRQVLEAA